MSRWTPYTPDTFGAGKLRKFRVTIISLRVIMSWCNRGVEESQARTVVAMSLTSDAKRVEYPTPPLQAQPNADFCGRKCFLPSCGARCAIQQGAPFSLQRSFAFWLACEGMLSWPQIYNPRLRYPRLHQYTAMDDTPWPRVLIFFIRN